MTQGLKDTSMPNVFDRANDDARDPPMADPVIPLPEGVLPDDVQEPTAEDIAQQIIDLESQQRLWLGVCLKVMQVERSAAESDTVARALDSVVIAAAARAKRILGSDGPMERA
jgi:hypothetical protein